MWGPSSGHALGWGPWLSPVTAVLLGGGRIESPLETVDFLDACPDILGQRFEGCSPEDFLDSSGKYSPHPTVSRAALCPAGTLEAPVALFPLSFDGSPVDRHQVSAPSQSGVDPKDEVKGSHLAAPCPPQG